ncbi:MAG: ATP-binding protein [Patescibacteria group bacterium]
MASLIFTTLTIIFAFTLGFIVYRKNPKGKINRLFILLVILLIIWAISNFLENEPLDYNLNILFLKIDFASASLIAYYWLLFCLHFPLSDKPLSKISEIIFFLPAIFFTLVSFTDLIVKDITFYGNAIHFNHSVLYVYYSIYIVGYIIVGGIGTLIAKYRSLFGIQKLQVLYVISGLLISLSIAVVLNLFLQNIVSPAISRIGIYGGIFFISFTAYAIIRYRLMDIRIVVRNVTVYGVSLIVSVGASLLSMFLASRYLSFYISSPFIGSVILVFGIIIFQLVKEKFARFANKYLFYPLYSFEKTIEDLSKKLSSFIDLPRLIFLTTDTLKEVMKLDNIALILRKLEPPRGQLEILGLKEKEEEKGDAFYLAKNIGFKEEEVSLLIKNKFLIHYLEKDKKPLVYDELEYLAQEVKDEHLKKKFLAIKKYMEKMKAGLYLPLSIEERLVGIFVLGKKVSGDAYSIQDLRLLETLSSQIAVAVNNAQLYEQMQIFNQILRAKVIKATKELFQAYKELKKLDESKTEFLSLASHQLRTPLSAMKGYLSMILEGDYGKLQPETEAAIRDVYQSNERLINLVNDLLNVTRIEAGQLEYHPVISDLEEVIKKTMAQLKLAAEKKNLNLEYLGEKIPEFSFDPEKIREVLTNLIDNAIKYTEKGGVTIKTKMEGKNVRVEIKDTGIGISPEKMSSLFQWFSRGRGAYRLETGGFGLGLYIAKKIVEKAGGKIWAESEGEGKGATFIFTLPFK